MIRNSESGTKKVYDLHDVYAIGPSRETVLQHMHTSGVQHFLWRREADWKLNPADLLGSFSEEVHMHLDDYILLARADGNPIRGQLYSVLKKEREKRMFPQPAHQVVELTSPTVEEFFKALDESNEGEAEFNVRKPSANMQPAWPPIPRDNKAVDSPEGWGEW